jgi:hypothetical protein
MYVPGDKTDDEGNRVTGTRVAADQFRKDNTPAPKPTAPEAEIPVKPATPEEAQAAADQYRKEWEARKAQYPWLTANNVEQALMKPDIYIKLGIRPQDHAAARQWNARLSKIIPY